MQGSAKLSLCPHGENLIEFYSSLDTREPHLPFDLYLIQDFSSLSPLQAVLKEVYWLPNNLVTKNLYYKLLRKDFT